MATRTISTKLAVEGEAAYKASLKNINSELGTLKSELKLVESEFSGQADSLAALQAKGETLSKMYEAQEGKVSKLKEALENAQKAQSTYGERVSTAQENIRRCEEALAALADETGDTSEEQARLTAELEGYNKELEEAEAYQEAVTRSVNSWQTQVNSAQAELNRLGREIDDNNRYLEEAENSSDECEESIDEYGREVKKAAEETDSFSDKLKGGLVAGAKAAGAALAAVGAAAVAGVKFLLDLEESTEEYRAAQGRLNTAFEAAGYSTDTAKEAYQSLYSILGDTDNATESAQLLAQLATSEKDVATWADIAAGVTGTFGDALPINSLIEASNETAKVGQVTGALADALNWVGISEDEFNEKLAACADEAERTALITDTLSGTYQNATDIFKENNATLIAANKAQAELDDTLARLGGTVADVKSELVAEFAPAISEVVDAFIGLMEGADGAEDALADAIDGIIGKAADKLPELLDFGAQIVINVLGGIANAAPQLTEGAVSVITTLIEGLVEALPQLAEAAIQIVSGLVTGIAEALPELIPAAVAAITQLVQALIENIPLLIDAALQLVTGLAQGVIDAIPVLLEAIPTLIESLVTSLLEAIPQIIETGVKLLTSLITNLPTIISELVRAMPQIITGMVNALGQGVSQFAQIGGNLVRGLWSGIQSLAGWLWDRVSSWISSIWDGICDFFGIHSPSKKMEWVSEMNVEGAVVGVDKNKGKAVKAYGNMTAEMLDEVEGGMKKVNASLADSIGEIETGFSAKATIEQVAASVPSLTDERSRAAVSGGGDTTVTNNFHIAELVVREEADVKKISRELYNMQKAKSRGKGVV